MIKSFLSELKAEKLISDAWTGFGSHYGQSFQFFKYLVRKMKNIKTKISTQKRYISRN